MNSKRRGHTGFTLLELLISIMLMALLLAIGLPALHNLVLNSRITAATDKFLSALSLARSEAIRRGQQVTMCHSADLKSCDSGNAKNWDEGWIIFTDPNADGDIEQNNNEAVLRVVAGINNGVTISSGGHFSQYVAYLPSGMSRSNMGAGNGSFSFCDERGSDYAKKIILNVTGRPRVADASQASIDCPGN